MTYEEAIKNINALNAVCGQKDFYDAEFESALALAIDALEKQIPKNPAIRTIPDGAIVDLEPVVRCKDCKYWQDNNDGYPHEECRWGHGETPDANDFCSYGERKECADNG